MMGYVAPGLSAVVLLVAAGVPRTFEKLPARVRERATAVVSGEYTVAKGPDEPMAGGGIRWPLLRGFLVKAVYRGEVKTGYVGVELGGKWGTLSLVEGRTYLVVLRPSEGSWRVLRAGERSWNWRDALRAEEVLAIVAE